MASPIDPEMCRTTGRLLTEWFEYPVYTDDELKKKACEEYGITLEEYHSAADDLWSDKGQLIRKAQAFVSSRKKRKWKHNLSQQEVAMRMNEATKMVDPSNFKFLPDDVRERTGLEINPLWMMECLVRSGLLTPKEQVAALKELAQYTHSKAPNINHNTTTHLKPEDWLLELAKDEYKEITPVQPMQPVERGAGKNFEKRKLNRIREVQSLINHGSEELAALESIVDEDGHEIAVEFDVDWGELDEDD